VHLHVAHGALNGLQRTSRWIADTPSCWPRSRCIGCTNPRCTNPRAACAQTQHVQNTALQIGSRGKSQDPHSKAQIPKRRRTTETRGHGENFGTPCSPRLRGSL